jgi:hypothetical protein
MTSMAVDPAPVTGVTGEGNGLMRDRTYGRERRAGSRSARRMPSVDARDRRPSGTPGELSFAGG